MQQPSFFYFIKHILFHPVQFTSTYLKGERATPHLRKYAWRTYLVTSISLSLFKGRHRLLLQFGSVQSVLIGSPLIILVVYAFFLIGYIITRWIFKKALILAGATTSEKKVEDINLYLLVYVLLLSTSFSILIESIKWFLSSVFPNASQSLNLLTVMLGLASILFSLFLFYIEYKVIAKTTNARPLKAILWQIGIGFLVGIAPIICLIALFFIFMGAASIG